MSQESFDPSKYKNIAEMPKDEQEKFEAVPTAPGDPEEFVMKTAVEQQKQERLAAEAEEIRSLSSSIKNIPAEVINDAHLINNRIDDLSYYRDNPNTENNKLRAKHEEYRAAIDKTRENAERFNLPDGGSVKKDAIKTQERATDTAEKENKARGLLDKLFDKNKLDSMGVLQREATEEDLRISKAKEFYAGKSDEELDKIESLDFYDRIQLDNIGSSINKDALYGELRKREPLYEGKRMEVKKEKTEELAALLHDEWRESRKKEDGTFEPRLKKTKDEAWAKEHGVDEIDIANTDYVNLPEDWKGENKISAEVAMGEVYKNRNVINDSNREAFIEGASNVMHVKWLERNGSWAPPEQKLPYAELSEEEKEKDRVIIRKALEIYKSAE